MAASGDSFFKGFIFGGIVGAVLGVLLAPKSGRETRKDLSKEAEKFYTHSKSDFEHARKAAMKSFEEGRDKVIEKLTQNKNEETVKEEETVKAETKPKRKSGKAKSKRE